MNVCGGFDKHFSELCGYVGRQILLLHVVVRVGGHYVVECVQHNAADFRVQAALVEHVNERGHGVSAYFEFVLFGQGFDVE